MLVLVLALVNCIIGVEAGLRYRVLVVLPLVAVAFLEIGLLEVEAEPWTLWGAAGLITSLQAGYLLGSAIRWIPLRGAEHAVLTPVKEPVDVRPAAADVRFEPAHVSTEPAPIGALKVLVIEDELDVSMLIEQMLRELGCTAVWRCSSAAEALDLLRERRPDAAVLDIKLKGELVYPVAVRLDSARIPFVFASGDSGSIPGNWARRPRVQKPFGIRSLAAGLSSALNPEVRKTA